MRTIWKFELPVTDEAMIEMPRYAEIIDVKAEGTHALNVWAIVDSTCPTTARRLSIRGTGHPLGDVGAHVKTVETGPFVWHVFEAVDR